MIREEDLREAIKECEGVRNPTASTCMKLASYYTILNQMSGKVEEEGKYVGTQYSYASAPDIAYSSSRFSQLVREKGIEKVFPILDEAMDVLLVVNTKLYQSIIRRLESVV